MFNFNVWGSSTRWFYHVGKRRQKYGKDWKNISMKNYCKDSLLVGASLWESLRPPPFLLANSFPSWLLPLKSAFTTHFCSGNMRSTTSARARTTHQSFKRTACSSNEFKQGANEKSTKFHCLTTYLPKRTQIEPFESENTFKQNYKTVKAETNLGKQLQSPTELVFSTSLSGLYQTVTELTENYRVPRQTLPHLGFHRNDWDQLRHPVPLISYNWCFPSWTWIQLNFFLKLSQRI